MSEHVIILDGGGSWLRRRLVWCMGCSLRYLARNLTTERCPRCDRIAWPDAPLAGQ